MRTSDPALALLLATAACGGPADEIASEKGDAIACRPAGAADFAPVCTVERMTGDAGLELTIRHPDGAFRRLLVTTDGRGVIAADGAEPAVVRVLDEGTIEVTVAGNAYRLPATVKGS